MLRPSFLLKILSLLISLGVVVYAIRAMNPQSLEKAMVSVGVEPGTADSPGLQPASRVLKEGEQHLNICRTRIHAIDFNEHQRVEELREGMKMTWLAFNPGPREIGYLQMEKWLSRHCQIIVTPIAESAILPTAQRSEMKIRFIDKTETLVTWIYGHQFKIDGKTYESTDFADALQELRELASFEKAGGP